MNQDRKESLLSPKSSHVHDDQQSHKLPPIMQQSLVSINSAITNPMIYDLPDMTHITRAVILKLSIVSMVCIVFLAAEVTGGLLAGSLAILSDAAHLFSDLSGFFISIFSIWLGQQPSSQLMSFGYHRAEVIGALGSIILIWALTIVLLYEATLRVVNKVVVDNPLIMLITAAFGLFCNIVMAKILHSSPTGGDDHGGNIFHQCDHDHGPKTKGKGHTHDHGVQSKKMLENKIKPEVRTSMQNINSKKSSAEKKIGHAILIVEDPNEYASSSSKEHNHSLGCDHGKLDLHEDHAHSDACIAPEGRQPPNGSVSQDNESFSGQNTDKKPQRQHAKSHQHDHISDLKQEHCHDDHDKDSHDHNHKEEKHDHQKCDHAHDDHDHKQEHKHDHYHDHDNGHDHDHDHEHNHDHDHNHDHNHDHKKGNKNDKNAKSSKNLSHINEADNYNLRAAMIHVIGDIVQSLGVLLAALLLFFLKEEVNGVVVYNNWQLADPLCTYLFSILVLFTTFGVAKECLKVLMEGTPSGMVYGEFKAQLQTIPRVREVHDLHIWSLSVGKPAMSAHIVCLENPEYVLKKATKICREFGIYHSTIQIEQADRLGKNDYIKCNHNIHQ